MWVSALFGMLVKYAEIYLGVKYRIKNKNNSYDGGPMIYLKKAFNNNWIPKFFALALCIYGVEIYMFRIITHSISTSWHINPNLVIGFLLVSVLLAGSGGVRLVGQISSILIPVFVTAFFGVSSWVFIQNFHLLPSVISSIFTHAFSAHAAIGGFAGSTLLITISQGVKRACYTGDIGIGYASVIHSETEEASPSKQASLGIIGIFLDTFIICTITVLLILITGTWNQGIHEDLVVAVSIGQYIPKIHYIWPVFIFLLGYSSLIAFYAVGKKSAKFLSPKYGAAVFTIYAIIAFLFFSWFGSEFHALAVMSIVGMVLLVVNLAGMFMLRNDIKFDLDLNSK